MKVRTATMIIDSIQIDEKSKSGSVYLWAKGEKTARIPYWIYANKKDNLKKGDEILYEPVGVNFGYFIEKVK